jgi:RNA polymerase sigma-70 factor (ECF subfamily)
MGVQGMDQERVWIEQALRGDRAAFNQVVRAYERPVYNLTYRMLGDSVEAEDAAQETFVRAYTRLATYDPKRKFVNWILSIASHHCIDRLRRRSRRPQVSLEGSFPPSLLPSNSPQPDEVLTKKQERDHVRALLDDLSPSYRTAVVLRYWYDYSYEEIAEIMDTTVSAIKSRLHRARRAMAAALEASMPVAGGGE